MRLGRQRILCVIHKSGAGGGDSRVHLFAPLGVFIWNGSVQDAEGNTPFQSVSLSFSFDVSIKFPEGTQMLFDRRVQCHAFKVVAGTLILRCTPFENLIFYDAFHCTCPGIICFSIPSENQKRAKIEWEEAQRRRMSDGEIRARLSGKSIRHQVLPMVNDDTDTGCGVTALSPEPPTSLSTPRATTNLWPAFSAFEKDTSRGKFKGNEEEGVSDELWQQQDVPDPIVECRDRSTSLWLHFPHVELGFLIFAFEGFIAAQVYGVRQTGCLPVSITAAIVLVSLLVKSSALTPINTNIVNRDIMSTLTSLGNDDVELPP